MAIFRGLLSAGNKPQHKTSLVDLASGINAYNQFSARNPNGGLTNYVGAIDQGLMNASPQYRAASNLYQAGNQFLNGDLQSGLNTLSGGGLNQLSSAYRGLFGASQVPAVGAGSGRLGTAGQTGLGLFDSIGTAGGAGTLGGMGTAASGAGSAASAYESGGLIRGILSLFGY